MRVIVIGLGVQGKKRKKIAAGDFIASVDPINVDADYKTIKEVKLDSYDAVLLCTPDNVKVEIIKYCIANKKHILVEKPLIANSDLVLAEIDELAKLNGVVCYTAYNHRFEPAIVKMKNLIQSSVLGKIYNCRLFYGNGTARLVKESGWRDKGTGVLADLGSHLLDILNFWFEIIDTSFTVEACNSFENVAPDHVIFSNYKHVPRMQCEATLLSWRNHFTCDIFAEKGSAHITSLCKWGPSSFIYRKRILPSGLPPEETTTLVQEDPTWELEYNHFKQLCNDGKILSLSKDRWLNKVLNNLGKLALDTNVSLNEQAKEQAIVI